LIDFLPEWTLHLRAAQRSPRTIASYTAGVRAFVAYAGDLEPAEVTPSHVRRWLSHLTEQGAASKTVSSRYQAIRSFFDWLAAEAELPESPVRKVARPAVHEPEIKVPTLDELRAVLATASNVRSFADVRDAAVIRLWLDTGLRRSELAGVTVPDCANPDRQVDRAGPAVLPGRLLVAVHSSDVLSGRSTRVLTVATGAEVSRSDGDVVGWLDDRHYVARAGGSVRVVELGSGRVLAEKRLAPTGAGDLTGVWPVALRGTAPPGAIVL
jgi:site-specific recombinase XerC